MDTLKQQWRLPLTLMEAQQENKYPCRKLMGDFILELNCFVYDR